MAIAESEFTLEFRRNWRVLVVASCCLLFALSVPAFFMPFLYPEVIREFGWTREQAVILASWKYVTGSVVAIVVGRFIDVIGVRRVMIAVSALGGLALLSFLWTPNLAVYYAAGIMLGFSGAGTMVSIKVLISRTFHASQGTAMGIAMLSTGLGQVIVPFAATFLIAAFGWRVAAALLSAGVWIVALPLMNFYLNDRSFEREAEPGTRGVPGLAVFDRSVASAFAGRLEFWLIGFAVFAAGFVDQAFSQHLVLYLREDLGLNAAVVASAIGAIGLVGVVTRPVVGGLFDGLSVRGVSVAYLVLATACLLALGALNPWLLSVFVVFRAVGHSAVLLDTLVLAKHTFGLRHIGVLLGVYTAAVNVGFAAGPPVVARLYSLTGSYVVPFLLCAVVAVLAALVLLPIHPAHRSEVRKGQADGCSLVSAGQQ